MRLLPNLPPGLLIFLGEPCCTRGQLQVAFRMSIVLLDRRIAPIQINHRDTWSEKKGKRYMAGKKLKTWRVMVVDLPWEEVATFI
jgi:hypothetical protein